MTKPVSIRSPKALWLIVLTAVVLAGVAVAQLASAAPNPPDHWLPTADETRHPAAARARASTGARR